MHYTGLIVKVLAALGAVHVASGAVAGCDAERGHGIWGPLVGAVRGVGDVVIGTANGMALIVGRLIPPKHPKINTAKILEGITVVASGPAFLGLMFAYIYEDMRKKGEITGSRGFSIEY